MTDKLRDAALMAVDALDSDDPTIQVRAALNLRAALAEPEKEHMTTEETIALANKAGWSVADLLDGFGTRLERFAKLVAEAEQEKCAKLCDEQTHGPKRKWVGLSDEDIEWCYEEQRRSYNRHRWSIRGQQISHADGEDWHLMMAVERRLKEKNT